LKSWTGRPGLDRETWVFYEETHVEGRTNTQEDY
jgi:hypothetical protein